MIPYKIYVREGQLFLALYGSTTNTIQSLLFLKNIKNFVWFPKQYLLGFFILEKELANILDRGFLFLRNTLLLHSLLLLRKSYLVRLPLFYSTLLTLTDRQNYRGTELQRNEYTRCAWAGGTIFPVVLLCQFLVLAGNSFWFYLLCTYVLRVQYSCGVVLVFWFWQEIVFGVMYVLSVQYSCAVVLVFWLWQEIVL